VVNQPIAVSSPVKPIPTTVVDKPVSNPKPVVANVNHNQDPIAENHNIPVTAPVKITIPNIFTPNGDGYNDFFIIEGIENCTDPMLVVRNSSGKTIFQSSDYQNDWNAENCPDGVYIYCFIYKVNNIEEKMMGKVIIKR
jgi:gliding motility-associated-like protein